MTTSRPLRNLRLGEYLVETGLVSNEEIEAALEQQKLNGGWLGQHLVLSGVLSRRQVVMAVAEQYETAYIDLISNPPDPKLEANADYTAVMERQWIVHHETPREMLVVTSRPPTDDLRAEISELFPDRRVEICMSTWWDISQAITSARREELRHKSARLLADTYPQLSAVTGVAPWQRRTILAFLLINVLLMIFAGQFFYQFVLLGSAITLAFGFLFKAYVSVQGVKRQARENAWHRAIEERRDGGSALPLSAKFAHESMGHEPIADRDLPTYTVLVPVYKEANVVQKVITHIGSLDYPKNKLQVLILLEETDTDTIAAARAARPPDYVQIAVVPDGQPRTKPRACNYGLALATGEMLVIYDAEDNPEPGQLRGVAEDIRYEGDHVICVQARLNYFNATQNLLTRLFTLEYTAWFDAMLPGLVEINCPIPLGGTSNHFRTDVLRDIGGWDPYNVTEDADIGLRAAALGWKVDVTSTTTWEEACSEVRPWIRQRTRWIKGYMMTTLVQFRNLRSAFALSNENSDVALLASVIGLLAATPLQFLAYLPSWILTLLGLVGYPRGLSGMAPYWMYQVTFAAMVLGTFGAMLIIAIAVMLRFGWRMAVFTPLMPLYWALHGWAAWRALFQILFQPFHWEKTPHGLDKNVEQGRAVV